MNKYIKPEIDIIVVDAELMKWKGSEHDNGNGNSGERTKDPNHSKDYYTNPSYSSIYETDIWEE